MSAYPRFKAFEGNTPPKKGIIMRIVFMGTPDFALFSLKALYDSGEDIAAVITQPNA